MIVVVMFMYQVSRRNLSLDRYQVIHEFFLLVSYSDYEIDKAWAVDNLD